MTTASRQIHLHKDVKGRTERSEAACSAVNYRLTDRESAEEDEAEYHWQHEQRQLESDERRCSCEEEDAVPEPPPRDSPWDRCDSRT